jgi:T4 superinfection immunity protein
MAAAVVGYVAFAVTLATTLWHLDLSGFLGAVTAIALLLLTADAFGIQGRLGGWWALAALALAGVTVLLVTPEVSSGFQQACQGDVATCQALQDRPAEVAGRLSIPLLMFLLPTIIGVVRAVPDRWLVAAINVLLGLSILGWLVALALSLEPRGNRLPVPLSGDRRWWWNGSRWMDSQAAPPPMAARSPDGAWWWNGIEWRQTAPTPQSHARMQVAG